MKILMRNTVFKTTALAGLFLCMMALGSAFSGITVSVHAMHGFIHADEVGTDEEKLQEFVEAAVDAYYIEFLLKQHCDLSTLDLPPLAIDALPTFLAPYGIQDLSPSSIQMLRVDQIKGLIALFNSPAVQALIPGGLDIWGTCGFPAPSALRDVFGSEEGDWRSGSIYLFVAQYTDQDTQLIYHGIDMQAENQDVTGLEDEGERMVMDLIEQAADGPVQGRTEAGFLDYCWEDPSVENDEIEDMNPLTAPGDSWKTSYVVDPFDYLGVPAPSGSPRVIFGSGIYPEMGDAPTGCNGNGIAGDGDDMDGDGDDMDGDGDDMDGDGDDMDGGGDDMDGGGDDIVDAVTGGGCTIAAGSDSMPRGTAFNLLLIVSALFFTISFRRRAMDK